MMSNFILQFMNTREIGISFSLHSNSQVFSGYKIVYCKKIQIVSKCFFLEENIFYFFPVVDIANHMYIIFVRYIK